MSSETISLSMDNKETMDNKENVDNLNYANELNEIYNSIEKICKNVINDSTLRKDCIPENVQLLKDKIASLEVQLNSLKETSTKEISRLKEVANEWAEKAKRKQESFVKLQDEKENMYKENRIAQEKLKETAEKQLQVYVEKVKHLEATLSQSKSTNDVENLLCRIDILSSENQAMQAEIISLRELHKENLSDNIKKLEEKLKILQQEKDLDDEKIKVLSEENNQLNKKQNILEDELSMIKLELSKANELAEKRKNLLDASSKELHSEAEAHRLKLEETKNKLGDDIRMLVEKNNAEVIELKSQIINHKKVKKELEELKSYSKALEDQSKTLQEKLDILQNHFTDSEENNKRNEEKHTSEINAVKESFKKSTEDLISKYCLEKESLEHSLQSITIEKNGLHLQVEKLKESLKDKDVEYRILNKKNEQMIKELKKNLVTERKKAEQAQNKLQDFIQDIKVKNTYDEIFNPESLQVKAMSMHRRQDSGSLSVVSSSGGVDNEDFTSPKSNSPMGSSVNIANLSDETVDLITKVADLQQEKWVLEEKVRHLEESGSVMAEDLMQKSLIIQAYVAEHSGELLPDRIPKTQTLKEKMFDKLKFNNAEDLMKEKTMKMQQMLEETLAKNAQLQKDLSYLTSLHSKKRDETL